MASKLPVWGIDIGQCSLKAIKLQASGDHVEMLAADVVEHETILSQAESDAPEMIKKAIETFMSRNELKETHIVVSVPGQQTLTRFTKMPPVEKKKIPDMVQYEASQQIPFDMDEVVWDYQVFDEGDSPDVEVGIFAIRKELIRNHLTHFMDAGIEPVAVQTSPMASFNAASFESPAPEGEATILLDMGALATDLIIFEGRKIWSRPVPIGGNRFTEALVSAFKISFRKAERLKRSAASSKYARQVFQAMRPVFADLVAEVQRSIGFYTSTHREARIKRILGIGNAFKLPGLQKFLQQNLQIEVEKVTSFKKVKPVSAKSSSAYAENVMSFGVAYGLALQGLEMASVNANLLPLEVRRTLLWRKKRMWFAGSAACLALAAGSLWVGNVMASGQLTEGLGGASDFSLQRAATVEQAEQVLARGGGSTAPAEWARKAAGAADKLQQEFKSAAAQRGGDLTLLEEISKLPENNVFLPRLVDVIHRAFGEVAEEELKGIQTAEDYKTWTGRAPRAERRELWIAGLKTYFSKTPAQTYFGDTPEAKPEGSTKPGWAVVIVGETTVANPTTLLDEKLIAAMDRLGKAPDRGMYFARITLANVMTVPPPDEDNLEALLAGDSKKPPPGRRDRGGRRSERDRPRTTRSEPGIRPEPGGMRVVGPGRKVKTAEDELVEQEEAGEGRDPLTGEETTTDQRFVIYAVVHQGDTPKEMIPEVYTEKGEEEKPGEPDS